MLHQINQKILKASKSNRNRSKAFQLMRPKLEKICWRRSGGCFIYSFEIQVISEKRLCRKVLLAIWEIILYDNERNYNSYRFSYKLAFILFLSFLTNQKKELGFQEVGGLVTKHISVFCL